MQEGFLQEDYLTTYTGIEMNPFYPEPDKIDIRDIAHALSLMTRANGHCPEFYSVGQHCILCGREAIARHYVPRLALACLLHDASEAYMSDVLRPLKQYMPMYVQIEDQLEAVIYQKYLGFIPEGEEAVLVRNIDDTCLYYEYKHNMNIELMPVPPVMITRADFSFRPMKEVEQEFLDLFEELTRAMKEA